MAIDLWSVASCWALFGAHRMVTFRVAGDSIRLLNLPARKPVVGGSHPYLQEGRMRGVVCASLLGLAATLAEGAPVMLAASLSGRVESW
jgi:hypothetical protein